MNTVCTKSAIATVLGRSRTTIYTEICRGSAIQIKTGKAIYKSFLPIHMLLGDVVPILNYRTPQEAFLEEVKKLVDLESVQFHIAI